MIIYKITNKLNNKIYIGQTVRDLQTRFDEHMRDQTSNDYFHMAVRKYGRDAFLIEQIDTAETIEELNEKEIYWIKHYNSCIEFENCCGYNSVKGGSCNPMFSEDIKEKHQQKMRTEDVRSRIAETMRRKAANNELFTEDHRKNLSNAMKGNQHGLGKKRPQSAIDATSKALFKKVYCIDEESNILASFDSVRSACEWWHPEYVKSRKCKNIYTLSDVIKLSAKEDRFILGIKWIYE